MKFTAVCGLREARFGELMSVDVDTGQIDWSAYEEPAQVPRPPRRRVRGLRFPVLLSGTNMAQLAGGAAAVAGVFMQWGTAIGLIVGGVVTVVLAALHESDKI
jgi:hypothetical protein